MQSCGGVFLFFCLGPHLFFTWVVLVTFVWPSWFELFSLCVSQTTGSCIIFSLATDFLHRSLSSLYNGHNTSFLYSQHWSKNIGHRGKYVSLLLFKAISFSRIQRRGLLFNHYIYHLVSPLRNSPVLIWVFFLSQGHTLLTLFLGKVLLKIKSLTFVAHV